MLQKCREEQSSHCSLSTMTTKISFFFSGEEGEYESPRLIKPNVIYVLMLVDIFYFEKLDVTSHKKALHR